MNADNHTYNVQDIRCDHCKRSIEDHVTPLTGVATVTVDIDNKTVTVIGGDPTEVESAIADAGYAIA